MHHGIVFSSRLLEDGLWRRVFGTACLTGVRASSPLRISLPQGSGAIKNLATRNRTRDHLMAAAFYGGVLYQLSYSRSVG